MTEAQLAVAKEKLDKAVDNAAAELARQCTKVDYSALDVDFADVLLGLLARQYQLWMVLVLGPSTYTEPAWPLLTRGLVDAAITLRWIAIHPESANRFKLYSAGRLKLLAEHWKAQSSEDSGSFAKDYAEQLEELASSEQWAHILPVDLSNWNDKDIRTMAIEADLKDLYDLTYSPLSADAHAEWMTLRTRFLRPCSEELHVSHWVPRFERPAMDLRVPDMATGYFLLSVQNAFDGLGLEFDNRVWEEVHENAVDGCRLMHGKDD